MVVVARTSGSAGAGVAREQATLAAAQKKLIAEQLTERPMGAALAGQASTMPNRCASKPIGNPLATPGWNGWGADAGNSRFQPEAAAGLTAARVPALRLKWAFGF